MRTAESTMELCNVGTHTFTSREKIINAINTARLELLDEIVSNADKYFNGYLKPKEQAITNLKNELK